MCFHTGRGSLSRIYPSFSGRRVLYPLFFFDVGEKVQELVITGAGHPLADGLGILQPFQIHINILPRQFLVVVLCLGQCHLLERLVVQPLLQ